MSKAVAAFPFGAFLEKDKLKASGANFNDWHRNLRIILTGCKKAYVLEKQLGDAPGSKAVEDEQRVFESRQDDYTIVQCAILTSLEPELQKCFEHTGAFEVLEELKTMFQIQASC